MPIETRVGRFDESLIRSAILRELNRGGQVYFVHNRVHDIRQIADRLRAIVPEARLTITHGQMNEDELETAMIDFETGRADILLATTIIKSGLDIPNANTMFIHQADIYGLADLHQLRGRVGRDRHRAYCYLLLENAVPTATNQALRYQSRVKIELPVTAWIPDKYVAEQKLKIEIYRRLSQTNRLPQLLELEEELRDRFGPIPLATRRLLQLRELNLRALAWRIQNIHLKDGYAILRYRG